jgi:hypothetical protein
MGKTSKTGFISVVLSTGAIIMGKFSRIIKGSIVIFSLFLMAGSCFAGLNPVKGEAGNYIEINYNTMETTQLPINEFGNHFGYLFDYPYGDSTFLILNATIENHGYDVFSTDPNNFYVITNHTRYFYDLDENRAFKPNFYSNSHFNNWSTVDIKDGESFWGTMIFVIPVGSTISLGYSDRGNPSQGYIIMWNDVIPPPTPTPPHTPTPTPNATLTPFPTLEPTQELTSTPICGDSSSGCFWLIANTIALIVVAGLLAVIIVLLMLMRLRKQEKTR